VATALGCKVGKRKKERKNMPPRNIKTHEFIKCQTEMKVLNCVSNLIEARSSIDG
jgi:hypothetical protein